MAQLDIKNIAGLLKKQVEEAKLTNEIADVGEVIYSGDGIIKVSGLGKAKYFEVLSIENGASAIALNLEENEVGAVVLDDDGRVYLAYHRFYTPLNTYTSGLGYHRETCVQEIGFDSYGYMLPMEPTMEGTDTSPSSRMS